MKKRSVHVVVLAVLSLLLLGPVPNSLARPPGKAPVSRTGLPKALEATGVSTAYGTGTVIHADALRAGNNSLVGLDVATSGAASSSAPLGEYVNEVRRKIIPKVDPKLAFGRGTGLELGILNEPTALIGQLSSAAAPVTSPLVHKVIGPIGIPGIVRAELLRSKAQARAVEDACVLGPEQGYGLGSVLDLEVLGGLIATDARPPTREVVQSSSTTRLVPGTANPLGLQSETRQTIAPVTLFKGTPFQFTIEVLGEWALRAVADGSAQGSSIHYGPRQSASPETPIVRILDRNGALVGQLTTQMLLGHDGLNITIPGIAEIVVGEDPRAINSDPDAASAPTLDPTAAAAAVDVVRVRLLKGQLADVRIGHMEAAVSVPATGVVCPGLTVNHEVDKPSVTPGQDFIYKITIKNPNDCLLKKIKIEENPSGDPAGVKFEFLGMTPSGGTLAGVKAFFPDLGPLGLGETKSVLFKVKVPLGSAAGLLKALGKANAVCPAEEQPTTQVLEAPKDIPVYGADSVEGPTVGVCVVPNLVGKQYAEVAKILSDAGCIVGKVTEKDGTPPGKVVDQGTPPGEQVPIGSPVDVGVNGPFCNVANVVGLTPEAADKLLKEKGCKLGDQTEDKNAKPEDAGKITSQDPKPGDMLPPGSEVDVTVAPKGCTVPNLIGLDEAAAKDALEKAGCKLGDVKPGGDDLAKAGKVTEQETPGGTLVPAGTDVDITIAGPVCVIPSLLGMTEEAARAAVEAQGCTLTTYQKLTSNPSDVGKVLDQDPTANLHVKKGSPVNVGLGVQVLGATTVRSQTQEQDAGGAAPTLVRTGGVALGGLALWLLFSGLAVQLAGSNRLWMLIRRQRG